MHSNLAINTGAQTTNLDCVYRLAQVLPGSLPRGWQANASHNPAAPPARKWIAKGVFSSAFFDMSAQNTQSQSESSAKLGCGVDRTKGMKAGRESGFRDFISSVSVVLWGALTHGRHELNNGSPAGPGPGAVLSGFHVCLRKLCVVAAEFV